MVKLDYLQKTLGVSLKIIHVIRNPYDNIATRTLRAGGGQDRDKASPEDKVAKQFSYIILRYNGILVPVRSGFGLRRRGSKTYNVST